MEEARPVVTLADLPNELLEQIIPDSKPKTISALKLVNRRFYDVFSADVYFKAYLRNPERYYKCEMKCEKHSGKDVVDEIKRGTLGKWKGYLTLQNLHLENLRCGRIKDCEIVRLPRQSKNFYGLCIDDMIWHDLVDENDEHWLLKLRLDGSIVLVNITNEPKFTIEPRKTYGGAFGSVRLLNGQVMCFSYTMSRVFVLDIIYDGVDIALQHCSDFAFDFRNFQWVALSGKSETNGARRNLFVSFRSHPHDGKLHFRDIRTGNSLEDISLREFECLNHFLRGRSGDYYINFMKSVEYPFIVMTFVDEHSGVTAVLVFNVDKNQPLLLVVNSSEMVVKVCITDNEAYVLTSSGKFYGQKFVGSIEVYRFPLGKHLDVEELHLANPLYQFDCCTEELFSCLSNPDQFAFIDSEERNKVHIISILNCDVNEVQVSLESLADNLMYVKCSQKILLDMVSMNEISVTRRKNVVFLRSLLFHKRKFRNPWPVRSNDLSKIVFYDRLGSDDLAIMYL